MARPTPSRLGLKAHLMRTSAAHGHPAAHGHAVPVMAAAHRVTRAVKRSAASAQGLRMHVAPTRSVARKAHLLKARAGR